MTQTEDLAQFDPASFEHIPVLLNECLDGLNIDPGRHVSRRHGGRRGTLPADRPPAGRRKGRAARLP